MEQWLSMGDNAGGAVANPIAPWLFATPSYLIWIACAIGFAIDAKRNGRLRFAALLFIGATSMFWQEFYADWGAKLIYTPAFPLMPWTSIYTTPNKPWFMPAAYGWYFVIIFSFQVWLVDKLRAGKPGLIKPVLMVAIPFFYLWDFVVEGFATYMGWWTYADPLPPVMQTSHGMLPLLHPIGLFTIYGVITTWVLARRDAHGNPKFEALGGASTMPAGPARELRRALTWIVVMNVVYFLFLTAPCMLVRIVFVGT
jgi:hypothetical protein